MTEREFDLTRDAFRAVLSTADGKRVLFWVLEQAGVYRDAFAGDDAATNYVLGQQAVGRKLIGMMDELDPRTYPKLLLDIADLKAMELAAAKSDEPEDDEDA